MLTRFDLRGTRVTTLPDSVGDLKRLEYLNLHGTMLTSLPESIGQLRELQTLDLSQTMLISLPGSIGLVKGLKRLILWRSKLRLVPESVGHLRELQRLDLSRTMLSSLPESIGQLRELYFLNLSYTMLSSLPDNISLLKGLRTLWLMGSKLRSFPNSLRLETLPDSIGKLSEVSELHLSDTHLSTLPEMLQSVPQRITKLPRLSNLTMDIGLLFKSLQSEQARSEGEDCATIDWPSESAIHAFLHQVLPSQAVECLVLSGRGYPQSGVLPLFLALQKMTSLSDLILLDFNLVETIPCELGELTSLTTLHIVRWETLRELPESLGKLSKLRRLQLDGIPSLRRLLESLSALFSLGCLVVLNCGSLQTRHSRASTLERKSSTSEGNGCGSSHSLEPTSPLQLQLMHCETDSWGLVECFLELGAKFSSVSLLYKAECKEFEKARKMAKMCGTGDTLPWAAYGLPTETGMDLFGGQRLHLCPESQRSTSYDPDHREVRPQRATIFCKSVCKIHSCILIRVRDAS